MSIKLQTDILTCHVHEDTQEIILETKQLRGTSITFGVGVEGQMDQTPLTFSESPWEVEEKNPLEFPDLPFTIQQASRIKILAPDPGVACLLNLGLSTASPLLFLQIEVNNTSEQPVTLDRLTLLKIDPGGLTIHGSQPGQPAFYSNGWQSWSATGAYQAGDQQHRSILGRFQNPMVVNPGTPKPLGQGHFSGDMFGVLGDLEARIGLLAGFLSQKNQFGSLETHLGPPPALELWANGDSAQLPPGESVQTDWAALGFIEIDDADPLQAYLSAAAETHGIQSKEKVPVGWCSWYHFYTDINEEVIESNLESVVALQPKVPLPLFQIDDGFETYPGDWFDFDPGFPDGIAPLAQKARKADLTPGIWLAPFIVHPQANLVKQHPDWLLRNKHGRPVTAGFVWNRFTYALDLTNPDALSYACQVIRTAVEKWGFEYLKLDFLYAAALDSVYQDRTKTRAQVLRMGLEALREAAGAEVTLLGCGCPLGSGLGVFEAMRISADVSSYWEPHFPPVSPLLRNEPHMPSARNALQNILSRAFLHRYWWINDPDCLLVRSDTDLTLAEVQTLTTAIGMTGGSLLLSDDLPTLPESRMKIAQALLPVIDQRAQIIDWLDQHTPTMLRLDLNGPSGDWHLLTQFNWGDDAAELTFSPQIFNLPEEGIWWVREFWTGKIGQMSAKSPFGMFNVPPHGVRVLAARPYTPEQPAYLGGSLHLSQGIEIKDWLCQNEAITFSLALGHQVGGEIFLYLPKAPLGAWISDHSEMPQDLGGGIYSLYLQEAEGKEIKIRF